MLSRALKSPAKYFREWGPRYSIYNMVEKNCYDKNNEFISD